MLRVHRAVLDVPYVPRKLKEHEVTQLLLAQRPVLLVGSSMVGKTRLAAQVVKQLWAERSIVIPNTPSTLVDLDTHDLTIRDHVIWLDDLERFFTGAAVTAGLIRRLAERNHVIATLRAHEWDRFQPSNQLRPPEWDVLTAFEKVTLDREHDRPTDDDLCHAVPDSQARARIAQVGIGEYVGAAQIITDQLALGRASNPLGYALVVAAVDWRRIGITRPVPADLLPNLAAARLTPRERAELDDPASLKKALAWATRKINPTVALLEPGDDEYHVYDYALDRLTTADLIIPTTTWHIVLDHATDDELLTIGYQAGVIHGLRDPADCAWRRAANAGNVDAMYNLGGCCCTSTATASRRRPGTSARPTSAISLPCPTWPRCWPCVVTTTRPRPGVAARPTPATTSRCPTWPRCWPHAVTATRLRPGTGGSPTLAIPTQ